MACSYHMLNLKCGGERCALERGKRYTLEVRGGGGAMSFMLREACTYKGGRLHRVLGRKIESPAEEHKLAGSARNSSGVLLLNAVAG